MREADSAVDFQVLDESLVGSRFWQIAPDLLGVLGADGYFTSANPAWTQVLGWTEDEVRKLSIFELLHPDDRERTFGGFEHLKRGNPILRFENRYRSKSGDYRWFAWSAAPYGDAYYCSGHDITLEKQQADQLELRETDLRNERRVGELREQFVAVLGHDLRNPLAAIDAGTRILARRVLDEQSSDVVTAMQNSTHRMANLIDNVLDFASARLGAGLNLARKSTALEPVLRHVVDEMRVAYPRHPIETAFNLAQPVDCDGVRIGQLLSNLLGNAIGHGEADAPVLVEASAADGVFELSVTNYGETIPPETMARLFQPFFRGDGQQKVRGLGLGLYIASEVARSHGGVLNVSSAGGKTRFTFRMTSAAT